MGYHKGEVCYLIGAANVVLKVVTVNHEGGLLQPSTPGADPYKKFLLPVMSQIGDVGSKQHQDSQLVVTDQFLLSLSLSLLRELQKLLDGQKFGDFCKYFKIIKSRKVSTN